MFGFLTRTFLKGLGVVLPIVATIYLLIWLVWIAETSIRALLQQIVPEAWFEAYYLPGIGLALVIGMIFAVGILMYPWLTRTLMELLDKGLRKVPLFRSIYGPFRDFMDLFGSSSMSEKLGQVVILKLPGSGMHTLGFVTKNSTKDLPEGFPKDDDQVVVYVQWGTQLGGFNFIVPRRLITPVNMSVEEGLRWALTAGVSGPKTPSGSGSTSKSAKSESGPWRPADLPPEEKSGGAENAQPETSDASASPQGSKSEDRNSDQSENASGQAGSSTQ